jgi:hypothetical protein
VEAEEIRGDTMNRKGIFRITVIAGVLALCSIMSGAASAQPVTQHVTLTGYITCTTCMLPNACKAQTRFGCTQWWVNQGASYVLVVGDTKYRLSGMEKELLKAALQNSVRITGDFDGSQVVVTNVDISHAGK